jgi:hypothetical protein
MTPKVFCVGFHKTGTTSLAVALAMLGYRVTGPNGVRDPDIAGKALRLAHDLVREYDAFQDNPWPVLYREMDESYPGSKFILMLRDPQAWIASQVRHFGFEETPMRRWIYGVGCPQGNEEIYLRRFERHNAEVQEHFAGRPEDLLVIELAAGDGWSKLCPFLAKPVPEVPFPHVNAAEDRGAARQAVLDARLRDLLPRR